MDEKICTLCRGPIQDKNPICPSCRLEAYLSWARDRVIDLGVTEEELREKINANFAQRIEPQGSIDFLEKRED